MYSICYSASLPIGASSLQYTRPRSVGRPVCEVRERDDEWVKWNVRNSMPPRHSETCFCFSFVWLDGIANDLGMVGSVATHRCRPPPPLPIIHARAQHESDGFYWAQFRAALRAVASYERHTQNCMRRMCVRTWRHRWCVRNTYLCAFFPLHLYSICFTLRDKNYRLFGWFERFATHSCDEQRQKAVHLISTTFLFCFPFCSWVRLLVLFSREAIRAYESSL